MKTYINNIPLESGEITVLMHENAETITNHACQTAQAVREHNLGVLLLNCATSSQRFDRTANKYITKDARNRKPHLYTCTVERGNLVDEKSYIEEMIDSAGVNVIIISGWEWTSSSWRKKERLIYLLRELVERKKVAIVIYSQSRTEPTLGEFDYRGIGKLAMIAYSIDKIGYVEQTRDIPKPPPLITCEEDREAAERSAQVIVSQLTSYGSSADDRPLEYQEAA